MRRAAPQRARGLREPGAAELVAVRGENRRLLDLVLHVRGVRLVVRMQPVDDGRDVRRHTRAAGGDAVLLARAGSAVRRPPRRMPVAALRRVEGVEAVTEGAGGVMRDEGVLPLPARTVHG